LRAHRADVRKSGHRLLGAYARERLYGIGYAGMAFVALALTTVISTRGFAKAKN
jgi:hypothetical protein